MNNDFERVLITSSEIADRVKQLAVKLKEDYNGKKPLFVCILKGSVMFFADLIREYENDCEMDFMSISSYCDGTVSGNIRLIKDLDGNIEGKDVIVVEDIIDSGKTLLYLKNMLLTRKPASLKIATLLDKPSRRVADIDPDYVGFEITDDFIVGYGLEYAQNYRQLPEIYILKCEVYEK